MFTVSVLMILLMVYLFWRLYFIVPINRNI